MATSHILIDILVVLFAAKVAGELAERIGVPAVCGEIGAGMLVGPAALAWVHGGETLHVLGQLGVILLLFSVGLETDVEDLLAVGRTALGVAVVGTAVTFALGYGGARALGLDNDAAVFVSAALTATSVGITARVFGDLGTLGTIEARTVLGAAVADDVIGLVVLAVTVGVLVDRRVSASGISLVAVEAVGFLVVGSLVSIRVAPHAFQLVTRLTRSAGALVTLAFAFILGMAELADVAHLAPIIGAFVAGLALRASHVAERVSVELAPVGHLFIPVFFLQIGIDADPAGFVRAEVLRVGAVLLAAAVVGKFAAALVVRRGRGDRLFVGLGMMPRGEVTLIFASIGLERGILDADRYASLLLVVIATSVMTPPLLRRRAAILASRQL